MGFTKLITVCVVLHLSNALKIMDSKRRTSNAVSEFENLMHSDTYDSSQYLYASSFLEESSVGKTLLAGTDSQPPIGVFMANGVGAVMVLAAVAVMKLVDEKSAVLGYCSIVCYLVFSVLIDTNIGAAGNSGKGFAFEPACAVLLVEVGKLVTSMCLYTAARWEKVCAGEPYIQEAFQIKDAMYLAIPGFLFALNNILVYLSLGHNEIASFGGFRDTIIFFNAALWCFVFKSTLGMYRMLALAAIFAGLCINQVGPLMNSGFSPMILIVLCMACTNACASVANEYAIKQNSGLDLNLQNAVLYCFCITWAIIYLIVTKPEKLSSFGAFFENFGGFAFLIVGLQLTAGLLVSRILKYADSITKNVACSLRGPILVFLAPAVGLDSRLDFLTGLSSVIVGASACYFLTLGKPAPGIDLDAKSTTAEKQPLTAK